MPKGIKGFQKGHKIDGGKEFRFKKGNKPWNYKKPRPEYIGKNNPNWKRGYIITPNGYVRIQVNCKPIFEHRFVMEQYVGRKLKKGEIVHHINGNKKDNRIKNLKIMKSGEHMSFHNKGKKLTMEHRYKLTKEYQKNKKEK